MFSRDFRVSKLLYWLVISLVLCAPLMSGACVPSNRTMARDKVSSSSDTLTPPACAELLFEEIGVSRPNRHGCWAAYVDQVYGTDDSTLAVLNHYDHPDGSSISISTDVSWDFLHEFEKHHTHFKTLFFLITTWQSPDMRRKCREY